MDIDLLLLSADKPVWIYLFGRFSEMKKAALEKFVPKCDISFFSLNSIKWAGRWGGYMNMSQRQYTMRKYHIPQPQKVRKIDGSFAWIDHRLMRNGYLQVMTHQELVLYLFLILAPIVTVSASTARKRYATPLPWISVSLKSHEIDSST